MIVLESSVLGYLKFGKGGYMRAQGVRGCTDEKVCII